MSGLETAFLRTGGAVVKHVATTWLTRKKAENRRGTDLTNLIALRFSGLRERDRRALRRKLEEVGEIAGERLEELCTREFSTLAENERLAALDAVVDVLDDADLSDTTLLGADLDPTELAKEVRRQIPSAPTRAGLSEPARALFDRALDLSCVQLVHLARELPEFDSRLSEESLRRATATLSGIDQILDRMPLTSLDAPTGTTHDDQFRHRYLDLIAKHHDDLELIGVSIRNFRPKTKLSVAYLSLTVNGDVHGDSQWSLHGDHHGGTMRVEGALSASDRVLVRGEAGSGKSTLLRWIVVQAAREKFTGSLAAWNGCVPVMIKLRSHSGAPLPQPEQFLDQTGPMFGPIPDGWMHRQLQDGRVLLLVDGVDELTEGQRPKIRRWLDSLLKSYPNTRIIVTSRPAAAGTKWLQAEGFTSIDLESMTPSNIQDFVGRWHEALLQADSNSLPFSRAEVEGRHRGLLAQLDARAHLRSLARSPLMCAMLCALNLDRSGDLPRDRKNLYSAALEMLLDRRDAVRGIAPDGEFTLGYPEKLLILQDLAFWLNLNGRSELGRATAVERIERKMCTMTSADVDAEACLKNLVERSGVIREPVEGRIDFVHRTFQEFLAAREAADDGHVGLLLSNAQSDQWRETILMSAGLLNRPGRVELLSGILDRADESSRRTARKLRLLAAAACESVHELPEELSARIDDCLDSLVPPRSTRESRSLATVGEPVLNRLPTDTAGISAAQAAACAYTAALVNGPKALSLLETYANDSRIDVQDELIDAWPLFDPETYARRVLAEAPLHRRAVLIQQATLLPHLGELRNLQHTVANFEDDNIGDLLFASEVPNLCHLRVHTNRVLSARGIAGHPQMRRLTLVCDRLLHEGELRGMPKLTKLFLNQQGGFSSLRFLTELEGLEFLRVGLHPDADATPFEHLASLRDLVLEADSTVDALAKLPSPEQMTRLIILSAEQQPAEFIAARFPNLQVLGLSGTTALDQLNLDLLPKLTSLEVRPAADEFGVLSVLPELRELDLVGARAVNLSSLTNEGLTVRVDPDAVVDGAERLPSGTRVTRDRPQVDHEALWKLRRHSYYQHIPTDPAARTAQETTA
ncbi:NACHT domain-containing protein [Saccharopolyspora indica]|uniref:NACHT domain-containing protein n=1 Tax=Saccharopolyspora indica TaxID=1229659 RepID=UPI0022EB6760|nr:NACHT domain-containing protein [Saccharopolyspora indica]MDA3649846.1 NACHT domain-containing protein [Saccharopolyspora indica]